MPTKGSIMLSRSPKNTFFTKDVLEIGVNSAIIYFNDGANSVNNVIMQFAINWDRFMKKANVLFNKSCIRWSVNKGNNKAKKNVNN